MNEQHHLQIHPAQRLTTPSGFTAEIDSEMVPLMRALWALNLTTTASCQDFGEGTAGQRLSNPHTPRYGGDAFIAYHLGYAWLKMPVADAEHLGRMLLDTRFRDKLTRRWAPGSWRMHVPLISDDNGGIALDVAAQIHFPREQITSLTATLESIGIPASRS
jgi:hypothetical protein